MYHTPILVLAFNRPSLTKNLLNQLRKIKPTRLFVAFDGPREGIDSDIEKCAETRYLFQDIDWDCELKKLEQVTNLGCGRNPATGISWFFENVTEGIILEDDCHPHSDFFQFTEEMLNFYREDTRIMMISGTNVLGEWKSEYQTYHFSQLGGIWGWATWRRAWNYFDYKIQIWNSREVQNLMRNIFEDHDYWNKLSATLDATYSNYEQVSWWDYQWMFARLLQSGLAIVPSCNLIKNFGFGEDATHTFDESSEFSKIPYFRLPKPYNFNDFVIADKVYDKLLINLENPKISKKGKLIKIFKEILRSAK